jgi:hypothetical protein
MRTVSRPSKNRQTQGYSLKHKGYDFSGRGDVSVYACEKGKVIQVVGRYKNSWRNTGKLTTRDYGNYVKLGHEDGFSLYAHLSPKSIPIWGRWIEKGEPFAIIGNTGNSTARHLHFEYRNTGNRNVPVRFSSDMPDQDPLQACLDALHGPEGVIKQKEALQRDHDEYKTKAESKINDLLRDKTVKENEAKQRREELKKFKKEDKERMERFADRLDCRGDWAAIEGAFEGFITLEDQKRIVEKELEGCHTRVEELERLLEASKEARDTEKEVREVARKKKIDYSGLWEAVKEPVRLLIMGVVSWFLSRLAPVADQNIQVAVSILVLRTIDKLLHQWGKATDKGWAVKGLTRF